MTAYARQNLWRVEFWLGDLDDLIAEFLWCWAYVVDKYYPKKAREPAHLMALFKLACHSHITTLSRLRSRDRATMEFMALEPPYLDPELGTLRTLVANAPPEVKQALEVFADPVTRRRMSHRYPRRRNGKRETRDERLAKLAGLPPGTKVEFAVRKYLSPD